MPKYLRSGAIQRLRTGLHALTMGIHEIVKPRNKNQIAQAWDNAVAIGLIGTAAELVIASCLYEVFGDSGMVKEDGTFPSATESMMTFRKTLRSNIPKLSTFTDGVSKPVEHLNQLVLHTHPFTALFSARAGGLHAGSGTSMSISLKASRDVSEFLTLLASATRWSTFQNEIPDVPAMPNEKSLLVQELQQRLKKGNSTEMAGALQGVFLVLPELAKDEPGWLTSLQRVAVSPKKADLTVLLKSLHGAEVAELAKVGGGKTAFATRIDPNSPNAIPIQFSYAKKHFDAPLEQWRADVGMANGNIDKNILDLPKIQNVYRFFATGVDSVGLPSEELAAGLSAHDLWPFIASALAYAGTEGPCFFLLRRIKPSEYPQLAALLKRAAKFSPKISDRIGSYEILFKNVVEGKHHIRGGRDLAEELLKDYEERGIRRGKYEEIVNPRVHANDKEHDLIKKLLADSNGIAACMVGATEGSLAVESEKNRSLFRTLIAMSTEFDEVDPLVQLLLSGKAPSLQTDIRKAIRTIDFALNGPSPK